MHFCDAPAYTNALHNYELLLRGSQVRACGELADLRDNYDTLDLTNNGLRHLSVEFPELRRLSGLLLAHNKIDLIDEGFGFRLPTLEMLSLANNELRGVDQLQFLRHMPHLKHLCLENNPITELVPDYRDHVVALQPHIRILDYQRVRDVDRQRALENYGQKQAKETKQSDEVKRKRESLLAQLEKTSDLAEIDAIDKQLEALS